MLHLVRLILAILLILALPAHGESIALVLSESGGVYSEFSNTLEEALGDSNWKIAATLDADTFTQVSGQPDLIVTVGSDALRNTLARSSNIPIIATLLPRLNYERIVTEARRHQGRISAIFLDQPLARQTAFVRHLLPGQTKVGMLFSNETRALSGAYRQSFANNGLKLETEDSDTASSLLPALNALLNRSNVLLAIPDATIYQRSNIKAILITAFRHQRPVIGYSAAFVNAGALAAIHTTPSQIARQTADMILATGTNLGPAVGPNQFAIAINRNVAQALGLSMPDEGVLRRAILADRDAR